jgi:hypothetical protein
MAARRVALASRARIMNGRHPKRLNSSGFPADRVIVRQGDAGRVNHFVESGAVEILRLIDGRARSDGRSRCSRAGPGTTRS